MSDEETIADKMRSSAHQSASIDYEGILDTGLLRWADKIEALLLVKNEQIKRLKESVICREEVTEGVLGWLYDASERHRETKERLIQQLDTAEVEVNDRDCEIQDLKARVIKLVAGIESAKGMVGDSSFIDELNEALS